MAQGPHNPNDGWRAPEWDRPPPTADPQPVASDGQVGNSEPPRKGQAQLVGTARWPQHTKDPINQGVNKHTLTFTLLTHDSGTVSVEMKGWGIKGPDPDDGEKVQVDGKWDGRGVLVATRIVKDTGAVTVVGGKGLKRATWIVGISCIAFVAVIAVVILGVVRAIGPTTIPGVGGGTVTVPAVDIDKPWYPATSKLMDAGLQPDTRHEFSNTIKAGNLIRTDPRAGTQVPSGSAVRIYISDGP